MNTQEQTPGRAGFYRINSGWYYLGKAGDQYGPFEKLHATEMGEWRHYETEICEPELSRVLANLP